MSDHEPNPRITVIIPVKDRAAYLYHTLRTCAMQEYGNFEVIVSDDGSLDDTRAVVEEAARKDPRIRYVTPASPGAPVGMLENFEYALDQVRPGYVLALGGDDGLLPHGIVGMRNGLRELGQQMLAWPTPVYIYPGVRMPTAQLVLHLRGPRLQSGRRIIRSQDFLERQARNFNYVWDLESPMFYVKALTSTRLVERVRARTPGGRFYACATPDGYSGIVLAGEVETWGFSGTPFSIHGLSPGSTGTGYLTTSDEARKRSEEFFKTAIRKPMHAELGSQPYSPLIALMTADYLLTVRDLPGWPGARPTIDIRRLLKRSLAELQDGLFAADRVARELAILYGVARHHQLANWFRELVARSHRNARRPLEGNAISPSRLYLDATRLGVENVYDAGYVAWQLHAMSAAFTPEAAWNALKSSVRYRLLSEERGQPFPDESQWVS